MNIVDMHCDTISALLAAKREGRMEETLRQNHLHIDLEKMKRGGYLLQNFALFIHMPDQEDPFEEALRMADLYEQELAGSRDLIRPAYCYADIERNRREGLMSAVLTVEEGGVCKGDPVYLRTLYRLGVRMLTLTWNFPNELGWPNLEQPGTQTIGTEPSETLRSGRAQPMDGKADFVPDLRKVNAVQGLTETGIEFIREMERLGMIVDVSHLSDKGFWDVERTLSGPFVASHSDARAVCNCCRNLSDEMIRALAQKGGVTGLNFCAAFLEEPEKRGARATISSIVEHAKHIVKVGGEDCLGLGSDFDGIGTHDELPDASCMPLLAEALLKGGFTERQVDKIMGGNVLRLYREVLN